MTDGGSQDRSGRSNATEEFLAMAVHELRTPLAAATGFASTLADRLESCEPEVVRDLVERILQNHRRLNRLIDDLTDLSALESGQLRVEVEPTDLRRLLDGVLSATDLGDRHLDLDVPAGLPAVVVDPGRLEQILANLLSNAAKFSPEGSTVTLRARNGGDAPAPRAGPGSVRVQVADQGRGIAPSVRDRVFDAYFRAGTPTEARSRGLGIGLYLARHLCQLMGAEISVEGTPGGGSTFSVVLPVGQASRRTRRDRP